MPKQDLTASGDLKTKLDTENPNTKVNDVVALSCRKTPTGWV